MSGALYKRQGRRTSILSLLVCSSFLATSITFHILSKSIFRRRLARGSSIQAPKPSITALKRRLPISGNLEILAVLGPIAAQFLF